MQDNFVRMMVGLALSASSTSSTITGPTAATVVTFVLAFIGLAMVIVFGVMWIKEP